MPTDGGIAILRTILIVSILLFLGLIGFVFFTAFSLNVPEDLDTNSVANTNSAQACATYSRLGSTQQYCATCGNGVCEPFEPCTASIISTDGISTADCGGLYCPADCEQTNSNINGTPVEDTNTVPVLNTNAQTNTTPVSYKYACETDADCTLHVCEGCVASRYLETAFPEQCSAYPQNMYVCSCIDGACTAETSNSNVAIPSEQPSVTGTCGDGICEAGEQCTGSCSLNPETNETVCTDSCGERYCPSDCG